MAVDGFVRVPDRLPPRRPTPNGVRAQGRFVRAGIRPPKPVAQQARDSRWTQVRDQPRTVQGFREITPESYALQRLAMLKKNAGFDPAQLGIEGDPAAQWRAISPLAGVYAAIRSGHAADYHAPSGMHPAVAALVAQLLASAMGPVQSGQPSYSPGTPY